MLIPLAVMSLPWVILGQVSKTLVTNRTHLTHEQLEATRFLFCQFVRRGEETPSPCEATGREGGGTHGSRRSEKPGDQGQAREHPQGGPRSPGASSETPRSSPRLPDTPASASPPCCNKPPQTERHSTRKVNSYLQTWEIRVLGSAGSSGGLCTRTFSLPASPIFPSRTILLQPKALSHPLPLRRLDPVESTCINLISHH